ERLFQGCGLAPGGRGWGKIARPVARRQFLGEALGSELAQEVARPFMGPQQRLDPLPQRRVADAGGVQVGRPLGLAVLVQGFEKDGTFVHGMRSPSFVRPLYGSVRRPGPNHATVFQERSRSGASPCISWWSQARA